MDASRPTLWYDLVEPLSYLLERELRQLEQEHGSPLAIRQAAEWNPPPGPLWDPEEPEWRTRREKARLLAEERDLVLADPPLIPWSRKAHELILHGREEGDEPALRQALFHAFHREGRDLGRVDVLVEIAVELGMDRSHTKAVLDVDRHAEAVARSTALARARKVRRPPALLIGDTLVRGFRNREELGTLLIP